MGAVLIVFIGFLTSCSEVVPDYERQKYESQDSSLAALDLARVALSVQSNSATADQSDKVIFVQVLKQGSGEVEVQKEFDLKTMGEELVLRQIMPGEKTFIVSLKTSLEEKSLVLASTSKDVLILPGKQTIDELVLKPVDNLDFSIEFDIKVKSKAVDKRVNWNSDIQPIMKKLCVKCHNDPDDLDLTTFNFSYWGDRTDEVQEEIVENIIARMTDEFDPMPPVSKRNTPATPAEIQMVKAWFKDGMIKEEPKSLRVDPQSLVLDLSLVNLDQTTEFVGLVKPDENGSFSQVIKDINFNQTQGVRVKVLLDNAPIFTSTGSLKLQPTQTYSIELDEPSSGVLFKVQLP